MPSTVTLASGSKLPILGFGVYQVLDPRNSTLLALQAGYRHIDSARVYRNELAVGEAVAEFKPTNKDANVFLTSKIQGKQHATAKANAAVDESIATLAGMGISWDLYLLHDATSGPIRRLEAWRVLEQKVKEGSLRAIGVSNFVSNSRRFSRVPFLRLRFCSFIAQDPYVTILSHLISQSHVHLAEFAAAGVTKPEVNQIELHPFNQQRPIVEYCRANGIIIQAYCPLVRGTRFDDPTIQAIAREVCPPLPSTAIGDAQRLIRQLADESLTRADLGTLVAAKGIR